MARHLELVNELSAHARQLVGIHRDFVSAARLTPPSNRNRSGNESQNDEDDDDGENEDYELDAIAAQQRSRANRYMALLPKTIDTSAVASLAAMLDAEAIQQACAECAAGLNEYRSA